VQQQVWSQVEQNSRCHLICGCGLIELIVVVVLHYSHDDDNDVMTLHKLFFFFFCTAKQHK